jgi:hypothetical protein
LETNTEWESAEAAANHEPIHFEGRERTKEKVPMAADNSYRAKAWECLSLAECLNDPEQRAEIVRFAWMWMSLAEPIEETRGSYEFPTRSLNLLIFQAMKQAGEL